MNERVPFPITEEMARAELKPLMRRRFRDSSMAQLTLVRFREFIREPEAVFWTFVFPILLAAGLGIAFRQRGPDKVQVGVVGNGGECSCACRSPQERFDAGGPDLRR